MQHGRHPVTPPLYLGIECGGTRTVALLADARDQELQRLESGPANLRLLNDTQLVRHFRSIAGVFPIPTAVAIGMAGARTEADWSRIRRAAAKAWPHITCHATNDLETALAAAGAQRTDGRNQLTPYAPRTTHHAPPAVAWVLILSGTGSCCYGRNASGKTAKIGGWGHVLGDKGSGFEIGLRALKAVVYYYDRDGIWSSLGQRILHALQLNEPDDLIAWVQQAGKTEIAGLAVEVFEAWRRRDRIATDILKGAAHSLAKDAVACAERLTGSASSRRRPRPRVEFILAGSVLLKQPRFAAQVGNQLRKLWPGAIITPLQRESVWGAVELAKETVSDSSDKLQSATSQALTRRSPVPGSRRREEEDNPVSATNPPPHVGGYTLSPTERRNPRSMKLDKLAVSKAVALMLSEDAKIPKALLREKAAIARAVNWIARAFKRGGRLFYVGAGTSGRLGVLDASECPPTFRTPPQMVQGIMAGGQTALWRSVEGAEDDREAGGRAIAFRGVNRRDVVVGIAASGRTPFVWGALAEARRRGATTILLAFNPHLAMPRREKPDLVITPNVGPEILTGSTRLKAGTATKLVLNIFTTLAMVRLGKVKGNLMVDLNPSNVKLRDRAVRIVQELRGVDYATARAALVTAGWKVKAALMQLARKRRRA